MPNRDVRTLTDQGDPAVSEWRRFFRLQSCGSRLILLGQPWRRTKSLEPTQRTTKNERLASDVTQRAAIQILSRPVLPQDAGPPHQENSR
jgi:hypothetical protein